MTDTFESPLKIFLPLLQMKPKLASPWGRDEGIGWDLNTSRVLSNRTSLIWLAYSSGPGNSKVADLHPPPHPPSFLSIHPSLPPSLPLHLSLFLSVSPWLAVRAISSAEAWSEQCAWIAVPSPHSALLLSVWSIFLFTTRLVAVNFPTVLSCQQPAPPLDLTPPAR